MTKRKIVVALGGNAILSDVPTAAAQKQALKQTAQQLVKLVKNGDELIVTHGNGPQVGNLLLQNIEANSEKNPALPLDTLVAMTEGSIGYWLQNALQNELTKANIDKSVASVVTQVIVNKDDEAFKNPTKPIGPFYTEEEAKSEMEKTGDIFKEDAGRGWRKVVASPKPVDIKEIDSIKTLIDNKQLVIAGGGGGVPVIEEDDGTLTGVEAVIDKDFASQKLASLIDADLFIVLTGVDNVYVNFNQPDQKKLEDVTVEELEAYIDEDQFAPGSMLPKIQATMAFVREKQDSQAIITSLDNLENLINESAGTTIRYQ